MLRFSCKSISIGIIKYRYHYQGIVICISINKIQPPIKRH